MQETTQRIIKLLGLLLPDLLIKKCSNLRSDVFFFLFLERRGKKSPRLNIREGGYDRRLEMLVPDVTLSVIKPSIALQSPYMQIRVSFLSSMKTPQNIYFYIWIPASQPSGHIGSKPRKITQ